MGEFDTCCVVLSTVSSDVELSPHASNSQSPVIIESYWVSSSEVSYRVQMLLYFLWIWWGWFQSIDLVGVVHQRWEWATFCRWSFDVTCFSTYILGLFSVRNSFGAPLNLCASNASTIPITEQPSHLPSPSCSKGLSYPIQKAPIEQLKIQRTISPCCYQWFQFFQKRCPNPRSPNVTREVPPVPWRMTNLMMSRVRAALDSSKTRPPNPVT